MSKSLIRCILVLFAFTATALPVWGQAKKGPPIKQPSAVQFGPENLARGKSAKASTSQSGHDPADGNDGSYDTRWCANGAIANSWWQVDLGKPEELTGCRVVWETDGKTYKYKVEGSADGEKWSLLLDQTKSDSIKQEQAHKFEAKGIRHVRITITGLPSGGWPSFWEFEVHGTKMVKYDPPAPPKVSLGGLTAPAGFDVTMFAAPPDISYPTCLCAAPDGTLFVGVDLNGSLGAKPGRGKIVRCIDSKGEGKADRFNVFANVDSPRGLWWDNGTLYVLHPPFLSAFHDEDGDGVSDRQEVLVKGIGFDLKFRGADHTTNGIRMGIDGWIYVAVGDYGFVKAEGKDGKTLQLRGGGIARVRPDGTGLEIVCDGLRNIYDVAISPTLDIFTRDNTNDGGGWDVRLAHNTPTGHYGYPRLFVNFPDEIIKPLFDYGGGSPTGAIYLDEPGFPEGFGRGLYTCEWGRSQVDLHPLTPNGSTFKVDKKTFLNIPRPTDIDVDGSSRLYVSSWNNGSFDFSNPNVGYVVRVTPKGWKLTPFPDLKSVTALSLIDHIASPSHVRRLAAQRQMLWLMKQRGSKPDFAPGLEDLAAKHDSIEVRVAAICTLKLLYGEKSHEAILRLSKLDALREYALHALADDLGQLDKLSPQPFLDALKDPNPRVRVQAIIGLNRLNKPETAAALLPLTADKDAVIAHIAINALVSLKASDVSLKALDSEDATQHPGALRVLQSLHEAAVVDGLLARLASAKDETLRRGILKTLARLYQKEADWDGKWWSTRPDTRGPYYNPVTWKESDKIRKALSESLAAANGETLRWFIPELQRHRVDLPEMAGHVLKLAKDDPDYRRRAVELFAARDAIPVEATPFFIEVAGNKKEPEALRAKALRALIRQGSSDAIVGLLTAEEKLPAEIEKVWQDFVRDGRHVSDVKRFVELTGDPLVGKRELAYGILATIGDRALGAKEARAAAEAAIQQAWGKPETTVRLLRAIARLNLTSYAAQIRPLLDSTDMKIASTAKTTLGSLKIDPSLRNLPLIGKMKYEDVLSQALKEKGSADLGAKIFQRTGCINCHTTSPTETLKGPLLAGITARYNRTELVESILKPSAKIAQGFETHIFELTSGKKVTGFIVKQSGVEIEIRDASGVVTILKKTDIEEQKTDKISVMPEKLVDNLTVPELASILAYLESLKGK